MRTFRLGALCAVSFWLVVPSTAQADTDACTLLTPAQVGAAVGATVTEGIHTTPTYVKTCTWNASGNSDVKFVTLNLQTAAAYDGGKQQANQMAALAKGAAMKAASVGEDAYYFVAVDQVGLLVKKGGISFKVAVYAKLPVEKKEAMEMTLAKQVLLKL
jgi:hypothetical protein